MLKTKPYTAATAEQIRDYRDRPGTGMMDAKRYFSDLEKEKQKEEMMKLVQNASLEDIRKILSILIESY